MGALLEALAGEGVGGGGFERGVFGGVGCYFEIKSFLNEGALVLIGDRFIRINDLRGTPSGVEIFEIEADFL